MSVVSRNKWSADFGLYKYREFRKESNVTKFVIVVTSVGIILFCILYLCIFLLKDKSNLPKVIAINTTELTTLVLESTEESPTANEKLVNLEGVMPPPRPFLNPQTGPTPISFIPIQTPQPPTTTSLYPQLSLAKSGSHYGYPRSIQEIIKYISTERTRDKYQPKRMVYQDPFYSFKPKEPGDINLLATNNLRFAPPPWKDFKSNPVPAPTEQRPQEVIYNHQHHHIPTQMSPQQPVVLTLNLLPAAKDPTQQNFYALPGRNTRPYSHTAGISAPNRNNQPRKLILHLNIWPSAQDYYAADEEIVNAVYNNLNGLEEMLIPPDQKYDRGERK